MPEHVGIQSVKMSPRLEKYLAMFKILKKASPKVRKQILKDCTRSLLCCICECVKNVLKGNVPLSKAQKSKLVRHRDKLRRLVLKKTRIAEKKKLVQSGGFLSVLIPPIAAFLGTLFAPKI